MKDKLTRKHSTTVRVPRSGTKPFKPKENIDKVNQYISEKQKKTNTQSKKKTVTKKKAATKKRNINNKKDDAFATLLIPNATSPAINDSASDTDQIGFTPFVQALARMIHHKDTSTPLTIGIYGPWGAGKTSFMLQLENEITRLSGLDKNNNFHHVKFDAWKHQTNEKVWAALLQAIPISLERNLSFFMILQRRFTHAWNKLDVVAKNAYKFILCSSVFVLAFNITFYLYTGNWLKVSFEISAIPLFGFLFTWKNIFSSWNRMLSPLGLDLDNIVKSKSLSNRVDSTQNFTSDLKHIIDTNVGSEGRLIIYIDDLDRCSPKNTTEVVEALNVFLDCKQCIFILGMDQEKVAKSIGVKYKELCDDSDYVGYGKQFLEKIIQLAINLPFMSADDANAYSDQLLPSEPGKTIIKTEENKGYDNVLPEGGFTNITMPDNLISDLKESIQYLQPRSPRNIKRFFNKAWFYFLLTHTGEETFKAVNPEYLGLWLLIHELCPGEIRFLKNNESDTTWEKLIDRPFSLTNNMSGIGSLFNKISDDSRKNDSGFWLNKYNNNSYITPYRRLTDSVDLST